jgi:hypothetical protein
MKLLRYVALIVLMCGLSAVARADDFQMVVVDPTYTGTYQINTITTTTFGFTFTECESPGQLPAGVSYDGCFSGQNETGVDLTSLMIEIPVFGGQTVGCSPSTTVLNLFTNISCGENASDTDYILEFTGGDIVPGELFTLAEDGVDASVPGAFPPGPVTANTPEPATFWFLSTGVLSIGLLGAYRRRQAIPLPRL